MKIDFTYKFHGFMMQYLMVFLEGHLYDLRGDEFFFCSIVGLSLVILINYSINDEFMNV